MRRTETEAEYEAISQPAERRVLVYDDDPDNPWGVWVPESEVGDRRRWGE